MPFLLHLILFLIPSPSFQVSSASQPIKMVISEQCVSDLNAVEGREVDLTPGSPLVLTHRIHLVPSSESGSCCQSELGAFLERMEALEREVSELREKCGGLDGSCCTSQQSKGPGCTTSADECLNDCSDQGRCVDGKCVCFPGFTGPDCSTPDCPGDCSNKGKCVNGKCVCDPSFTGPDCSIKTCPKNCSSQGKCVNGKCVCNTGFTGLDCSESSCPGNCNNKGRCVNGKCVCKEAFTGPDCSERSCPGNCNNKGRCVNGKCVCDTGFTGPDCSERSCPGNCNNKGRCVNGKCVCKEAFTGPDCSERSCPGNCNNKGRCVNGKCVCDTGFTGPDCSERSCPGNCNNKGRCVNGKCVCKEAFTGPDCSERSCPGNCNNKGRCVNGKCVCDTGFTGPDCSESSCPGNCNNKGRCVNGKCVCDTGFTGLDCSERSCPGNCNNKGRCVNGKCVCDTGFMGPDCSESSCPGNCNNKGRCVNGKCVCDTGFTGLDCSERSCPGNCNNKGRCVNGKCVCDTGFTGLDCSERSCPGNCTNKGRCVNGQCLCEPGFTGTDCSTKSCPNNCNNRGRCVNGKCVCNPGFAEPDCNECKDGFSGPDCATALIAVSELRTRNIMESSVTLFWTQPTVQYDTYLITFTSEKESDQKIIATVNGEFSTYTQVGLAPGQRYNVTIVGEIDGKMGAKGTTTFQTLISGPKNLEVVKRSTTSVIVQWEEAQGELDRYVLSVSPNQTDGSGKGSQVMRLPPGRDSAQIDGLEPGRLYDISLVAEKDGTRSLPATIQATPGINAGLPDPASRPPKGSGGKMANLRLTNTTKGSSSQYQSNIHSSNQQQPELSRNVVKPTVLTERNLTAYGINGTKYVRRVWLGHRKLNLNGGSNGNTVARNMSVMVGNVSRNDILTNIPDRLAGFSDEVRPLDGKGPKVRDGRYEENPTEEDLETEKQEKNQLVEMEAGMTPSPSLPLATNQGQPSLVPSEIQDQPTNKGQATSRDGHYTKTSQLFRSTGRPTLHGSPGMELETLKAKTTASEESQPDYQGLLDKDSSVTNWAPLGTKDTENTSRDNFPKHIETINKTRPLYHRTSHSGTFSRRPNIGPFQNRTSHSKHPYRGPLRRPLLPRGNSTARNNLGHGLMGSRQSDLNHQTPVFIRQRKNGTVLRFPPKPLNQIKLNLKNDTRSKADVGVDKNASKETLFVADKDRNPEFDNSPSTDNVPFKRKATIQPVSEGTDSTIDHTSPRDQNKHSTFLKAIPHHPRISRVFSDRQNASNLEKRPTFIQRRKNNTVFRLPPKLHTDMSVNSTSVHSSLKDGKESQIGLLTTSTEEPPVNRGSENTIEHLPRNTTLHKLIDLNAGSVIKGHRENVDNQNVRSRKKDGTLVRIKPKLPSQITPNSTSIYSGLKEADTKVVKDATAKDSDVGNDNILPSITNRDYLSRVTKDQELPSDINREDSFTIKQHINQNVPRETTGSKKNLNLSPKFVPRTNGSVQPKPHNQMNQVSTTIQSALIDTDPSVKKASKESTELTGQAVDEGSGSEGGFDSVPAIQMQSELKNNGQIGPTPNFTATFPMRNNNGTVFRQTLKPKFNPNLHGDSKPSSVSSTTRTAIPQSTINRNPRPIIHRPTKVFPQLRPNSTRIHDERERSKSYPNDPKHGWSTKVPLATNQTNTSPSVSEDSISQVEIQNVTSKGFLILWVAPEGKFKNFVIRTMEELDQGMDEGDGSKHGERKEKTGGKEITANVLESMRRNISHDGVRKKLKLLPGSARSHPVTDLTAQTNYSVSLYGAGPGFRSNVHTFIVATGPEPPSHLSFSEITDSSLTVSWRRPKSSVSGFKVTYTHTKEGEPISVIVDSSSSALSLIKLSPGSPFEISVISVLGLDESDPIKDHVITLPDPPTDLRAINITDTKALLAWRPALATVDQYIITYRPDEAPGSDLSVSALGNAVEQQLQALKASTKYSVTIVSRLGEQKSSSTQTTFTTASGSPGKGESPRDLTAKHVTAHTAVLSWKPPASAVASYKLTYFIKDGEREEVTLHPGVTEHTLRGLRPSTTYLALLQGERGGVYTAAITTEFTTGTLRFPYPSDCSQEQMNGETDSGLVEIFPGGKDGQPVMVYCDMETDGGGWTVFQRRKDGKTNFFHGWQEYRKGFGDLEGEFWLGNDFLHNLTIMTPMTMRVDLRSGNESAFAHYATFSTDTMRKHYTLRVSGYSGTAGDSLKYHDKRPFSTFDRDPQPFITRCAMSYRGGWWYKNCHEANLNGQYDTHTNHQGVIWTAWKGKKFSIAFSEMKLRPASFKPHSRG